MKRKARPRWLHGFWVRAHCMFHLHRVTVINRHAFACRDCNYPFGGIIFHDVLEGLDRSGAFKRDR